MNYKSVEVSESGETYRVETSYIIGEDGTVKTVNVLAVVNTKNPLNRATGVSKESVSRAKMKIKKRVNQKPRKEGDQ